MNSFDVFDTLLARRFVTSAPLFNQLENETNIADFAARRMAADDGSRSLAEIYDTLELPQAVMHRELQLEFEHAIPIRCNLRRVQHGDLLISDMYMSASDILRMVRGVGMDRQVTVFQSNKGKSSGSLWRHLIDAKPQCHLGDNAHSDYRMPTSLGFTCELYEGARLNRSETVVMQAGLPLLACLMREIRLGATNDRHPEFFHVAVQLNLPWLFVTAELLRRKHEETLTFLGRDCQLLSRVFNAYFGPCHYLPFSRRVAYAQPVDAVAYLKAHLPANGLMVDLSSTGATWERLDSDLRIETVIYSDRHHYTPRRPSPPAGFSFLTRNSECGQTNELIEIFNCGDHGYLERVEIIAERLTRAVFAPLQLDPDLIEILHAPVRAAEALAPIYRSTLPAEIGRLSSKDLFALFEGFSQEICAQQQLRLHLDDYFRAEAHYKNTLRQAVDSPRPLQLAT